MMVNLLALQINSWMLIATGALALLSAVMLALDALLVWCFRGDGPNDWSEAPIAAKASTVTEPSSKVEPSSDNSTPSPFGNSTTSNQPVWTSGV